MIATSVKYPTFKKIPAFAGMNESECRQLAEVAQEKSFLPGQAILEQGKISQDLWIVLEGTCQVVRDRDSDGQIVLAEMEPYSLFGEMSFFSPAPHSATVVATTQVKLLCINRVAYDDLIHDGVVAAYKLAYNVVESVATRLRRMDEWVTELAGQDTPGGLPPEKSPEWRQFREKLFYGWNL